MLVLHLIDAQSHQATGTTLALLAAGLGRLGSINQSVLLLGAQNFKTAAFNAGITHASSLGVPYGNALLAWPAVRRRVREICRDHNTRSPDLIHCWSLSTLALASLMFPATPRLLTLTIDPTPKAAKWLRFNASESLGQTTLLPISATIRHALLSAGVPQSAVHVLRPAIDMSLVNPASRAELRRLWNINSDNTKIIALLSDPPSATDAISSAMTIGLADETNRPRGLELRLLVHPQQLNLFRAVKILRPISRAYRLLIEPRLSHPWTVLPACDFALARGNAAGGLSMLWAMAANTPIVAEATYAISEIVEDRRSALLAKPNQPKNLAMRINQLLADPQLAWKLKDTARHEAYSFFSRQQYCQSLRSIYEQSLQGSQIRVPALPSTGGLRFPGRA